MSVIIDNGSYSIRAGFLNDPNPRHAVLTSQERSMILFDKRRKLCKVIQFIIHIQSKMV